MPSRTQELAIGIGFAAQSALQTALSASDIWTLRASSFNPAFPDHVFETDADDFNKGDEFATQVFPTSLNVNWQWPYFLTSQNAAQVIAFALGKVAETNPATGAYQYVCTAMDPVDDGVNLPSTTVVAGLRAGTAGEMLDMALIGLVCDSFEIKLASGPGRQNATITSNWVGCGKYTNNSGITIPAVTTEKLLQSGGATVITINGINYFSAASFVETTIGYNNNVAADAGFYPGSGQVSSAGGNYDIRGRMRFGKRTLSLSHVAELESDSTELSTLLAGTEGTATITVRGALITGSTYHQLSLVFQRLKFRAIALGESNGFTTVVVTSEVMKHSSNGVLTATVITDKTGIAQ